MLGNPAVKGNPRKTKLSWEQGTVPRCLWVIESKKARVSETRLGEETRRRRQNQSSVCCTKVKR